MLVAPPGHFKTSMLSSLESQLGVAPFSDITTTELVQARDDIASKKLHTLIFYDMQKLYERRQDTASNIIGNLRALMDEGFASASYEATSKNMIHTKAKALVLGAMTPSLYREKLVDWEKSGFARRVLFCVYTLKNPEVIEEAILREKPIDIRSNGFNVPINLEIDFTVTRDDDAFLLKLMRKQREDVPLNLLKKIMCVLRWKYKERLKQKDRAAEVLYEFGQCLGGEGAEVEL